MPAQFKNQSKITLEQRYIQWAKKDSKQLE